MMENYYNSTTGESGTPDYTNPTMTNARLRDNTRRVVSGPNTLAGGLPFDGQDSTLMDSSRVNIEHNNFNNNDSYYQYPSTSFVPGGTRQPPVLQPRPLGLHRFDHNLPNDQSGYHSIANGSLGNTIYHHDVQDFNGYLNPSQAGIESSQLGSQGFDRTFSNNQSLIHSMINGLPMNTTYHQDVPGFSGYLNPSHAGFNSSQWNFHGFDPNLSNNQSLIHSMVNGLPINTTYHHDFPRFSSHLNSSQAGFNPILPLAQHHVASRAIPTNDSVSKTGPYFCSHGCGTYFKRKKDMERHVGVHLKPTLFCPVSGCHKAFYRKDKLREHRKTHGGASLPTNGAIM